MDHIKEIEKIHNEILEIYLSIKKRSNNKKN